MDTNELGRQSWALTPSLPRPKHEHSADAPHRSESLLGIKHSSGFRLGRLATSQVRNCRISFTRQDDCSSKGRSIPDPTLRHQNSLESDFMTLPKPYDISVVLLDQALQVRRSSTLETHPTTAVSPLHLLAYLAHHLAPCSRRFQLKQGYGVDQAKAECQASVDGDLWIRNTWGSSSTCRCVSCRLSTCQLRVAQTSNGLSAANMRNAFCCVKGFCRPCVSSMNRVGFNFVC